MGTTVSEYDPAWPAHATRAIAALGGRFAVIQRLVDAARTARGLPLVAVWEQ
ncbi:hypothetical protein [Dactylosporangium sp. CA-233914]|uniref:hypothetical protein n=1 Tax=Dactylosporangium sp. CA-233914 TaxID=3239934 RepID=UPI003D90A4F7